MKKQEPIWKITVIGILTLLCFYVTWGLATISGNFNIDFLYCLFILLTGFFYLEIQYLIVSNGKIRQKYSSQFTKMNSGFLILGSIIYFTILKDLIAQKEYLYILGYLFWIAILCVVECKCIKGKINKKTYVSMLIFIKEHRCLCLLLFVLGILAPDYHGVQFKWDGALYYAACQNLSLDSISNLAIYGHIAQTFGTMIQVATQLFGNVAISMVFWNVFLLLVSSCAFYGTLKLFIPDKNDIIYTLGTAVYAFSPFLLGMVNYYSLDYYCLCLSIFVFYYGYKKQWLLFIIFGLLFCFTKEPAIIIYGTFCAGIVLVEFIQDKEKQFGKRLCNIFKHSKYYGMAVPGILWLVTYIILGPWSAGNSAIKINFFYIIEKIKVLYFLNFNWIYTLIILLGILYILRRGKDTIIKNLWLLPVGLSQIGFTVFSCVFKTVNHPRYSDSSPVFLYLVSIIFILKFIQKKYVQNIIMTVLSCLMLLSSFYTIDPVSKAIFEQVNIGKATMVVPQPDAPGDGMIYNKQLLYLERTMELALADAIENKEIVVFPAVQQSTYYFDGMAEVCSLEVDKYIISIEWWDDIHKKRKVLNTNSLQELPIVHIGGIEGLDKYLQEQVEKDSIISFVYLPFAGEQMAEEIKGKYNIINEKQYEANNWIVKKVSFAKR